MTKPPVILSMLHESLASHSAVRTFRGQPVLAWTLKRLARSTEAGTAAILCWDDQHEAVSKIVPSANIHSRGPRQSIPMIESVAAARRWSDGWRGGLLATCEF